MILCGQSVLIEGIHHAGLTLYLCQLTSQEHSGTVSSADTLIVLVGQDYCDESD